MMYPKDVYDWCLLLVMPVFLCIGYLYAAWCERLKRLAQMRRRDR
jgi:hypothetical protein